MTIEGASSTSSLTHWKYDVFISFRGEDTRNNFTDHLHDALKRKGIKVFKDDKGLRKGKSIAPELFKAIETSRISIIVFSTNYASSTWCLDELIQIVRSMNENKQIVFPIFYDVDPSVVRNQKKEFQQAFIEHERKNGEKVQNWRTALKVVADLSGFHLKDRPETDFIQDIVKEIRELIPKTLWTQEGLVGMKSRLETLTKLLTSNTKSYDVEMIGIYGMGGIGKTTIARAICDSISHQFEGICFLANVREISKGRTGLVQLQKQLLSQILGETDITIWDECNGMDMIRRMLWDKKVLIVVDDVDDIKQLRNLVGNHSWFGLGSRVIITTRDKHLLVVHEVDKLYEVEPLNRDDALELFCSKAFKNCQPSEKYLEFSKDVVNYAGGLPLALEILGCFLVGRTQNEWKSALERLRRDFDNIIFQQPRIDFDNNIFQQLRISYDGLKETEKEIFLDIACFFKGKNRGHVTRILDGCGFSPDIGISVLVDKCLLKVSEDNKLWMHDLLQEMGQQIVETESIKEPEKRSRLWKKKDVLPMLAKNMGTNKVEGIILEEEEQSHVKVSAKAFLNMTKLRLLKIRNVRLSKGLKYLSNELCLFDWHGYSSKSLPSGLRLDKIVVLKLKCSRIEQLWKEVQPLNKLKVINLSHSKMFKKTPDLSKVPNLEELILEGCTKLCEIHSSLLVHKKLTLLNMKDCTSLTTLPSEIGMESLKTFILSGCLKLKKFPDQILGSMERLAELFLDRTPFKELPLSIAFFKGLILLSLEDCKNLVSLSSVINGLQSLKILRLSRCPKLENFPENLWQMEGLEELDIRGTATREPMTNSWYSHFPFISMLRGSSGPLTLKLPSLSSLISLKRLDLSYRNMEVIPLTLKLPSFSSLISLKRLDLGYRNIEVIPTDIGSLASLKVLNLEGNNFVSLPASINRLSKLEFIYLSGCKKLQSIVELPSNLDSVFVEYCISLETFSINALQSGRLTVVGKGSSFKLFDYDETSKIISALILKEEPAGWHGIHIKVLGSEIPKWFRYQSEGSSIKIKARRDLKLKGYVLCAVFSAPSITRIVSDPSRFRCTLSSNIVWVDFGFGYDVRDHLWLMYVAVDTHGQMPKDWYDFELKYGFQGRSDHLRRCGAHPLYEEEVDQECSRSVSGNLIEFHQDSVGPNIDFATTNSKRSLTDYDGAETSTGSANSDGNDRMNHDPKGKKVVEFS